MKKFTMFACLALSLVFALNSFAGDDAPIRTKGNAMIFGGGVNFEKAGLDTINLMAAADDPTNNLNPGPCSLLEPYYPGDFETGWQGFEVIDVTLFTKSIWNVSDYQQSAGNLAVWCGDINIPSCSGSDPDGGYGNNWHDLLKFSQPVGNATQPTSVTVTANLVNDTDPGYDYTILSYIYDDLEGFQDLNFWDDIATISVNESVTFLPLNYVGGTDVVIYWRVTSDGAWSDEDCLYSGTGACQVDDINIMVVNDGNTDNYFEDFQATSGPEDYGPWWDTEIAIAVGNFGQLWEGLDDADPCAFNDTWQVIFIDDNIVVPGTGGSDCINWCYGPGGYIATPTGGLVGPDGHLNNSLESPVMDWPQPGDCSTPDYDGADYSLGVYSHESLAPESSGILYMWSVRSADTDDSGGGGIQVIEDMPWRDRNFVYYGGPGYIRTRGGDVTDLMSPGRDEVQVRCSAWECGWWWGVEGVDGSPGPYFDNFTLKVFEYFGPGMSTRTIDLAQDNFPESGLINMADPGSHSVRFDGAMNISTQAEERNDPGDSITVFITPIRANAKLDSDPEMHYLLKANPVFDAYRSAGFPDQGMVLGQVVMSGSGGPVPNKYSFDLPDTGFLFPGDVLHYYFKGSDSVLNQDVQEAIMPADTTGYSTGFDTPMGYNPTFVVRALPSIVEDGAGGFTQPGILWINDNGSRGGENEWYFAFNNLGLVRGVDYDVYFVTGPSSGVGNGIGGRATSIVLEDYSDMLYCSGPLSAYTISNGDWAMDAGNDLAVLTAWLDEGDKDMLFTGDGIGTDLTSLDAENMLFLEEYMGLVVVNKRVDQLIGNQTAPKVVPITGNDVFHTTAGWIAFGGCPGINNFDACTLIDGAVRIAEFVDPLGAGYPYSAATLKTGVGAAATSRTISLPYDLMYINTDQSAPADVVPVRVRVLEEILAYFGVASDPPNASAVPGPGIKFQTSNYPNPFNPSTTIKYTVPKSGHMSLKVYNVRGQLVRTLIDGQMESTDSGSILWDGTNNQGSSVSSGVYFYEARTGGDVKVQKMALVK